MMFAAAVGLVCVYTPRASPIRLTSVAGTAATSELTGVVTPTPSPAVSSWYDAGGRTTPEDPATLLQRYMQLRNVLPDVEGLPDEIIVGLIRRVEAEADSAVAFDDARIQGEWQLVYQQNTKQATRSQKALSGLPAFANFMLAEDGTKIFRNIVNASPRITVIADVAYTQPQPDEPVGRLGSTIDGGVVEVKIGRRFGWSPLRVPLPLRGIGWLDVTYLSKTMRVTRGNRGGLFVHMRPELISRGAAESSA